MAPAAAASVGRKSTAAVLLLYVTFSFLLLLLLPSYSRRLQPHDRSLHRLLELRPKSSSSTSASSSGAVGDGGQQQNHHAAPFDPAIAELERRLEDKEWEREHYRILHGGEGDGEADEHTKEWEEFLMEEEDFINDDERFNLADRIRALFPKIDVAPQDGFVSLDKLTRWNLEQARADQLHRSVREMELYDKNGDGIVSFGAFGRCTRSPMERVIRWGSRGGRRSTSMLRTQTAMVS